MRPVPSSLVAIVSTASAPLAPAVAQSPAPVSPNAPACTVHVKNFAYAPTPLRVRAGDRGRFVNDDDEAHTVTAIDRSFDSDHSTRYRTINASRWNSPIAAVSRTSRSRGL